MRLTSSPEIDMLYAIAGERPSPVVAEHAPDAPAAPDGEAEIASRGTGVCATYVGRPDSYEGSVTREGWFRSRHLGCTDVRLGERIEVGVVPEGNASAFDKLVTWATDRGLPKRWLPEQPSVVDAMPTTAAGKIGKAELRPRRQAQILNQAVG